MPGVSVPPIATKESEFTASKGSRPPAFPPFTQGRPSRIYTTVGYRVWLCHLPAPFLVPAVPFSRLTEVPQRSLEDWQGAAGSGPQHAQDPHLPFTSGLGQGLQGCTLVSAPSLPAAGHTTTGLVSLSCSLSGFPVPGSVGGKLPFPC